MKSLLSTTNFFCAIFWSYKHSLLGTAWFALLFVAIQLTHYDE